MRSYSRQPAGTVPRARGLRRDATDAEKTLWRALREALPHAKWRRQVPIGPYFADFLSFPAKLVVEADGGQHGEAVAYDDRRTAFIETEGYRVLRFWNSDVMGNLPGVLQSIAEALQKPLSRRERGWDEGNARMEGKTRHVTAAPSPSHAAHGSLPLPMGEGL